MMSTIKRNILIMIVAAHSVLALGYDYQEPDESPLDEMMKEQQEQAILTPEKLNDVWHGIEEIMGLLSQSKAHKASAHIDHLERGAWRSGSGTPKQQHERERLFEEAELLEELEESKEVVQDPILVDKLYKRYQKSLQERKGAAQNDQLDIEEIQLETYKTERQSASQGRGRALSQRTKSPMTMQVIEEPYPTSCQNSGQLTTQMQRFYLCRELKQEKQQMSRVTYETYMQLKDEEGFRCQTKNVTKNVCVCPKGYGDFECGTHLYQKCLINITEPAFYKGCNERKDTPYYFYSMPGYDPCYYLNFSRSQEIKFNLNCKVIDEYGLNDPNVEAAGYKYRDVIQEPKDFSYFSYVATNPETQFSMMQSDHLIVQFDFRDFKYLSNVMKSQVIINDPAVMVGLEDAAIELDFPALLESDEADQSRFVNGGRVYFEANVFGYQTSSFTTKGFFDQLGYEEPKKPLLSQAQIAQIKYCFVGLLFYLMLVCLWKALCTVKKKIVQKRKSKRD